MEEVQIRTSDLGWETAAGFPAGTQWKVLRRDARDAPLTVLLKLPAGFELAEHSHVYTEHHYVLEGAYESADRTYPAGSYRMIPAHKDHGPFRSPAGAQILVLWLTAT